MKICLDSRKRRAVEIKKGRQDSSLAKAEGGSVGSNKILPRMQHGGDEMGNAGIVCVYVSCVLCVCMCVFVCVSVLLCACHPVYVWG